MCALPQFSFIVPNFGMRKGDGRGTLRQRVPSPLDTAIGRLTKSGGVGVRRRRTRGEDIGELSGAKKTVVDTANYKERYIAADEKRISNKK